MIVLRKSEERRHVRSALQDTWLTFDAENRVDPMQHGFHALETLNEEHPAPEMGLLHHRQGRLEAITYVRKGTIIHQETPRKLTRLRAGEFQHVRVGNGVVHRSVNASLLETAQVFQSFITLEPPGLEIVRQQRHFPLAEREGLLRLVVSRDGRGKSLRIHPDVSVYSSVLPSGDHVIHELRAGRGAWLQVVKGRVLLGDHYLGTGDGAGLDDEPAVAFTAQQRSEILLFDLA